MLNAICVSPKSRDSSKPCLSASFLPAFCRPSKGRGSSLIALFELKALSSLYFTLPSLLFMQPSLLINYSSLAEKKPPPACRRGCFAVYSPSLSLLVPEGCRETAPEATKASTKTEAIHCMVSLKWTVAKSLLKCIHFSYKETCIYSIRVDIRPSNSSHVLATFNMKSMNPLGKSNYRAGRDQQWSQIYNKLTQEALHKTLDGQNSLRSLIGAKDPKHQNMYRVGFKEMKIHKLNIKWDVSTCAPWLRKGRGAKE